MRVTILTLFPQIFRGFLEESLIGKAVEQGLLKVDVVDIRGYASGKHRVTDDTPFGGGVGMVLKPEPVVEAVEAHRLEKLKGRAVLLTPRGELFSQPMARELSAFQQLLLICGRYEGVDERVTKLVVDQEISIGDYVLMGGEVAAMVVVEAVARYLPGVVGDPDSVAEDSFSSGLLKYPQYTRPREYRGLEVPEALLEGDHRKIERWRRREALRLTLERRPDLIRPDRLSSEDLEFLKGHL
ncbi:MAG: tRNA (guanosine(37)-N1)-methyltransferase TrmD [Deltaproteobacteria bacterium]|nr:tRNA (guanosine(37)-N1)-methyltransferase TrmD [Deltaproteobacteria bacterium]